MKLYWRVKRNGKWTWKPAVVMGIQRYTEGEAYYIIEDVEE